jgi:hypothetical protein
MSPGVVMKKEKSTSRTLHTPPHSFPGALSLSRPAHSAPLRATTVIRQKYALARCCKVPSLPVVTPTRATDSISILDRRTSGEVIVIVFQLWTFGPSSNRLPESYVLLSVHSSSPSAGRTTITVSGGEEAHDRRRECIRMCATIV